MKMSTITTVNQKGQIVIPVAIRNQLGITDQVSLFVAIKGNAIHIVPIKEVITLNDHESSYEQLLKRTLGSWKSESAAKYHKKKKLELDASTKRKIAW